MSAFGIAVNLIYIVTLSTCILAQDNYDPTSYSIVPPQQVPELINKNPRLHELSLDLEVPREEAPLPFYPKEPVTDEKVEIKREEVSLDYPVPSDELTAPRDLIWNPDNNPNYYFGPIEQPQTEPPKQQQIRYPKKYIKELHEKDKPSNYKNLDLPKIEKILYNLSKNENRANLQKERQVNTNKKNNGQVIEDTTEPIKYVKKLKDSTPEASFKNYEPERQQLEQFHQTESLIPSSSSSPSSSQFNAPYQLSAPLTSSSQKKSSGERMEFQMHGFKGPKSYKWGYDTGKGYNRHFRFEERDKDGLVKGQYGYHDKNGKLRIINYHAHPQDGFHAEESQQHNDHHHQIDI